jgi:hypothetical protein
MISTKKKIIASLLIATILTVFIIAAVNKDRWFQHYQTFKYLGCNETYLNGKLITKECPEKNLNPTSGWKTNWTLENLQQKN